MLHDAKSATTRLHALWTLDGLESLQASDVAAGLRDAHPNVRIAALKLAGKFLRDPQIHGLVVTCAMDSDVRVRFQVALTLSESDSPAATATLCSLALKDGHDPWFADGLLTSAKNRAGEILASLVGSSSFH